MVQRVLLLAVLGAAWSPAGASSGPALPAEVLASPFGVVNPWPEVGSGGMGAVWCRCGGGATALGDWRGMMPLAGCIRWDAAEREWQWAYVKEKLVPCPILSYTPSWASRAPGTNDPRRFPPADLWDYYEFCRAVAAHFAGRVWFWEVWNEPNITFFRGTIAEYADMLKTAAVAIRNANPRAYVIFGGTAGVDIPFFDRCYQYGAREYFDVAAAHPYQWGKVFDDRWFFEKLSSLRAEMRKWGDTAKPIWLNEFGWSTASKNITEADQARLLVQCFVSAIARRDLGIQRAFWFCVKNWGGPGYGLYAPDGRKKPAWFAYRTMVSQLRGLTCWGSLDVGPEVRAWAFTDHAQRRCVVVFWSTGLEPTTVTLHMVAGPTGLFDLMGESKAVPPVRSGRLTLGATPAPQYLHCPPEALRSVVQPITALPVALPNPSRRRPIWLSLYPQRGCSLPWLRRGGKVLLRGRLFNASEVPVSTAVRVVLRTPDGRELSRARKRLAVEAASDLRFSVRVPCPDNAPARGRLEVAADGLGLQPLRIDCFIGDGPVVNFLANSHLERALYLQPGAKSGTAESVRFGTSWVYKIPVPAPGSAKVTMDVGAHRGQQWSVAWSEDGETWRPLMSGHSTRAWHTGEISQLRGRWLYLRCQGNDQQVGQVVVRFRPAAHE